MRRMRITIEGPVAVGVLAIGLVAGVAAALGGLHPTGHGVLDAVVVVGAVTACVWASAAVHWWVAALAATALTSIAPTWWLAALGALALGLSAWLGWQRESLPLERAGVAGLLVTIASRLDGVGPWHTFGLSSLAGVGIVLCVAAFGFRRHTHRHRTLMWRVLGGVGVAVPAALLGLVVASLLAEDSLRAGNREARAGIELFRAGDLLGAADQFAAAATDLHRAHLELSRPWAQPVRLVPIIAQHRNAAAEVSAHGSIAAARIADLLRTVDYESLSPVDGRISLDAVRALDRPLHDLAGAVGDLDDTLTRADSPWLVFAVGDRLDRLRTEVAAQRRGTDNAVAAIEQAPEMLGASGPRHWFVAFTTPVEARASGGYMGSWALLTIDRGQIDLSRFGNTLELNQTGADQSRTLEGVSDDYVANYGTFIYADQQQRLIGPAAWSNITTSPDFPTVAATIAELFPKSGGLDVDGVLMLDTSAIARLMDISGPITVPGAGVDGSDLELTSADAAQYLMVDQYRIADQDQRRDALEDVARTTFTALLSTTFPSPPKIAELMSPMAHEGRLAAWAPRDAEQDVFTRLGLSGALPTVPVPLGQLGDFGPTAFGDGITYTLTNATGNKIDYYLDGTVDYRVHVDRDRGVVDGTLTLTLTNSSPTSGWGEGVIGNELGLPTGTNRTWLSVYTALPSTRVVVNGSDEGARRTTEHGWWVSSRQLDIAPGETVEVVVSVRGGP
ncbi:MAG: DUF4012 domain-containing protein, partial [Ilumatobacteraceae bacterium]